MALFSCLNVSHSGSDGMKLSTFNQVLELSTCLNLSVYFYFLVFFATLHFHYILGSKYFTFYSSYSTAAYCSCAASSGYDKRHQKQCFVIDL